MINLAKLLSNKTTKACWTKWKVARTIWPYPEGYGTYRENIITGERTILDTGLTREAAEASAKELNS